MGICMRAGDECAIVNNSVHAYRIAHSFTPPSTLGVLLFTCGYKE